MACPTVCTYIHCSYPSRPQAVQCVVVFTHSGNICLQRWRSGAWPEDHHLQSRKEVMAKNIKAVAEGAGTNQRRPIHISGALEWEDFKAVYKRWGGHLGYLNSAILTASFRFRIIVLAFHYPWCALPYLNFWCTALEHLRSISRASSYSSSISQRNPLYSSTKSLYVVSSFPCGPHFSATLVIVPSPRWCIVCMKDCLIMINTHYFLSCSFFLLCQDGIMSSQSGGGLCVTSKAFIIFKYFFLYSRTSGLSVY